MDKWPGLKLIPCGLIGATYNLKIKEIIVSFTLVLKSISKNGAARYEVRIWPGRFQTKKLRVNVGDLCPRVDILRPIVMMIMMMKV